MKRSPAAIALFALAIQFPASAQAAAPPAKLLDLSAWKLTIPAAVSGSAHAAEIRQPELNTFQQADVFFTTTGGVVFRAPCGGATTKGSHYPRCELREMLAPGSESPAAWSTDDDLLHVMTAELAVTHLPAVKPHVVCAQIHDAKDDLIMVRVERTKLLVERKKAEDVLLDRHYQLATPFKLRIEAGKGRIKAYYNDALKMDWPNSTSRCYFKIGCYTQSNPAKGDRPDAYGEVVVRQVRLERGRP